MVVLVPEATTLTSEEWNATEVIVARAIAARPSSVRRQIGLFLRLVDLLALVRFGCPLTTLAFDRRTQLLESLGKSRLLPLRRGIWGLRTLAFMGYYARPEAAQAIGYRASPMGWSARRAPDWR